MLSRHELFSSVSVVPGLDVSDVVIEYGDVRAVDNVSFSAPPGEVTVVLGPNGAGKTSTIEVCEGFRHATSGSVSVEGLHPIDDHDELTRIMGVMLQGGGVYPSARVVDVVSHFCALYGNVCSSSDLIAQVGLTERRHSTWRKLSGGEQQRLSLALALAGNPRVLFLDEPTSGVDVNGRAIIRHILRDFADRGATVLVATHELDEAERIADTVVIFDHGRVVANGTLTDLRKGGNSITFTSRATLDVDALSVALGVVVTAVDQLGKYSAESAAPDFVVRLSAALAAQSATVESFSTQESLESIFQRLTTRGDT